MAAVAGRPICSARRIAPDVAVDYQKLRHTRAAALLRMLIYRLLVGREGWPLVFRPPSSDAESPRGTSPHLYVHLPFCRPICPHCPYNKVLYRADLCRAYGPALRREMESYLARPGILPVQSLYFGGGTPSLTPELIERSIECARPFFAPDVEIGVEAHPGDAGAVLLKRLRDAGVNRISLGIETFRPDLLKMLGRRYTPEQGEAAIRMARAAGFECVDVNLIYSIPGQDETETAQDAERCIALDVDQISAYPLFTFAHTPLGQQTAKGRFPIYGDRARLRAQKSLSRVCREGGLARSSVWSFTRPGVAPYSTVTHEDYVGFGAGAGSKVGGVFWFNTFSVDAYIHNPSHRPALVMEAGDRFRRVHWLYWQIYRTVIDPARYYDLFGRDLESDFGALLLLLTTLGMARREGSRWRLTEFGAVWVHRAQSLFSLSYIDEVWTRCRGEAWPQEVALA